MLRFLTRRAGPIFAKEMIEMARRRRYFFNRALDGLVLLLVLFSIWQDQTHYGFGDRSIQDHAHHSPLTSAAWHTAMLCYWLALLASIVLMRGWPDRNFDRVAEDALPRNLGPAAVGR